MPKAARELFAVPLKEFTKRRNDLAKELKAAGDSEGSKKVAAIPKPSLSAWALNQVARWNPKTIEELLRADETLRNPGSGVNFRQTSAERSRIVGNILQSAREVLEQNGHSFAGDIGNRITQTLLAIGTDDGARGALVEGRLVKDLEPGGLMGQAWSLPDFQPEPEPEPRPTEDKRASEKEHQRKMLFEEIERLTQVAEAKRQEAATARQQARQARREAERAEAEASRAEQEAEQAAQERERKRAELP